MDAPVFQLKIVTFEQKRVFSRMPFEIPRVLKKSGCQVAFEACPGGL